MNRLILIGNGFDLAHGLKTSTRDFVEDYFKTAVKTFMKDGYYTHDLFKMRMESISTNYPFIDINSGATSIFDTLRNILDTNYIQTDFELNLLKTAYDKYKDHMNLYWLDLEVEYFRLLTRQNIIDVPEAIKKLNNQFEVLKKLLIEYLKRQNNFDNEIISKDPFVECFTEHIFAEEIVTKPLLKNEFPKSLYFLNFNYTDTIKKYVERCSDVIPSELNYIHGCLTGEHGEPIFGFGDEYDKRYVEFENKRNNELFRYIKSFEYLKSTNYYSLVRFIESDEYQVHVYGHSCGISDRTMLKQIFEHENCRSIKVFYQ